MKKSLSAAAMCSALVLSLGLATANAQEAVSASEAENSDLYFVELVGKPVADGNTLASVRAEKSRFMRAAALSGVQFTQRRSYDTLFNRYAVRATASQRAALARLPGVARIWQVDRISLPDFEMSSGGAAPDLATAIAMTGASIAQSELGFTGAGIKVAVLDTGVDLKHPALAGHLLPGWDFVDNDNDPSEVGDQLTGPYGHGTHVAGLVSLVAPDAKIIPIRVLDKRGMGNIWVLAEALAFAVNPDGDPKTADGADVINLSLSTLRETRLISSLLKKACGGDSGDDKDFPISVNPYLVVVAAAGNGGDDTRQYPAAENVDGLIAVGATTVDDTLASFSSRGSWVQVAAPGQAILSTVPNGQYATWSGTSMAAPLVAGEAALVRAHFPKLVNKDIARQVIRMSVNISGDVQFRIDAGLALTGTP